MLVGNCWHQVQQFTYTGHRQTMAWKMQVHQFMYTGRGKVNYQKCNLFDLLGCW